MTTGFLLTWNDAKWGWHELAETADRVRMGQRVTDRWNCKQGAEPRGIMASGWVKTAVFQDLHWEEGKAAQGVFSNYVIFEYDALLDPYREAILERDYLKHTPGLSHFHWDTRSSGNRIGTAVLQRLEEVWSGLVG
jgi:hypothetical protein